ncbi:4168_t:CDS:1, partial [Ambispora leptoticha]
FSLPNKIINDVKLQKFRFPVPDFEKLSRETPPQEFSLPADYNTIKRRKAVLSNGDPGSLFFDENSGVRRSKRNR